ncbi:MAG: hypothetical protein KF831_08445 [Acidobacteria bacterium]|nr:hypothetical protein [Acidobacteriota bacterium]
MLKSFRWIGMNGIAAAAIAVAGCGGSAEVETSASNAQGSNSATAVKPVQVDPSEVNSPSAQPSGDANANVPLNPIEQERLIKEERARQANIQLPDGVVHPGQRAEPLARPAPDDSTYSTKLTDVATETRQFRSHPQINKVERITTSEGSRVKIYLKNGKVVDADPNRFRQIASVSVTDFILAAGLTPPPTPTPPPATAPGKGGNNPAKVPNVFPGRPNN